MTDIGEEIDAQIAHQGVAVFKAGDDSETFVFTTALLERLLEKSRAPAAQGRVLMQVRRRPGA